MKKNQIIFSIIILIAIVGTIYLAFFYKPGTIPILEATTNCAGTVPITDISNNQVVKCTTSENCAQFMLSNGATSSDISSFNPTCQNGSCQIYVNIPQDLCQGKQVSG